MANMQHEERIVKVGERVQLFPRVTATIDVAHWPGGRPRRIVRVSSPNSLGLTFLLDKKGKDCTVWQLRNRVVQEQSR